MKFLIANVWSLTFVITSYPDICNDAFATTSIDGFPGPASRSISMNRSMGDVGVEAHRRLDIDGLFG